MNVNTYEKNLRLRDMFVSVGLSKRLVDNNRNKKYPPNENMLLTSKHKYQPVYTVKYVLHKPSSVPQFDQVVKGTGDQLVLVCRRPLHSGDPASVGGQRQQHQRPVWRGGEVFRTVKRKSEETE